MSPPAGAGIRFHHPEDGASRRNQREAHFDYWLKEATHLAFSVKRKSQSDVPGHAIDQLRLGWDTGLLDRRAGALETLCSALRLTEDASLPRKNVLILPNPARFGFRSGNDLSLYQLNSYPFSDGRSYLWITSTEQGISEPLHYRSTFLRKEVFPGLEEPKLDAFEYDLPIPIAPALKTLLPRRVGQPKGGLIDVATGRKLADAPIGYHFDFFSGDPHAEPVLKQIEEGAAEAVFLEALSFLQSP